MRQTWRWFGPHDSISIAQLKQVGVEGVVSALHHFAPGQVWSVDAIRQRQKEIGEPIDAQPSGLSWEVVESLPVSEAIKTQNSQCSEHMAAYKQSLENLAACGLKTICYNFMPILDWTRTQLRAPMVHGGTAMLFDLIDFAVFDLFILKRAGAEADYSSDMVKQAKKRFNAMDEIHKNNLQQNIVAGLPGANDNWTLNDISRLLECYATITPERLRDNLIDFLQEVVPVAEKLGMRLCCHPDDPPFSLLGLPRVMSTEADYAAIMKAVDAPASGITLCTGSMNVRSDFDAVGFVERWGSRIHFAHLRNTTRHEPALSPRTSFHEAAHLEGDTPMVDVVRALMQEQKQRKAQRREDWRIPMRPDHGQDLLFDLQQGGMPGYPLIGRMRGLAELRGIMAACES